MMRFRSQRSIRVVTIGLAGLLLGVSALLAGRIGHANAYGHFVPAPLVIAGGALVVLVAILRQE